MSRVAKNPVPFPSNVVIEASDTALFIEGPKGKLYRPRHPLVDYTITNGVVHVSPVEDTREARMHSGTAQRLLMNDVHGVSSLHTVTLQLVGVGYSARLDVGKRALTLLLGFSHPVLYALPDGVEANCTMPTEVVLQAADKQVVTQAAADIRSFRPPEPYKGKGVRYVNESVRLKEAKKK